jgi:hypothetical protein
VQDHGQGEMSKDSSYDVRYCAFVDILGFRNLISDLNQGKLQPNSLRQLLRRISEAQPSRALDVDETDFRATSISDAIAISTRVSIRGLYELFQALELLALDVLRAGYFVRGAVVKGRLCHEDRMVFGEALVSAYHLESQIARYPRIMIRSDVFTDAVGYLLNDVIRHSEDGPYHLHIFRELQKHIDRDQNSVSDKDHEKFKNQYHKIAAQIQNKFHEAVDDPRQFEKVQWFAKYWNQVVSGKTMEFPRIFGAGLEPQTANWA